MIEKLTQNEVEVLTGIQSRINKVYPGESDFEKLKKIEENLELVNYLYEEVLSDPNSEKARQNIIEMIDFLTSFDKSKEFMGNVEMLAAERILRLCQYIDDPVVVKNIVEAVVARASFSSLDAERGYFLGLLHHFSSVNNYKKIEETLSATQLISDNHLPKTSLYDPQSDGFKAMSTTIPKIRGVVDDLKGKNSKLFNSVNDNTEDGLRRYLRTIEYISNDFTESEDMSIEEIDEINTARLLSRYYEDDYERPEKLPDGSVNPEMLLKNLDADHILKSDEDTTHEEGEDGIRSAYYVWALRAGYHPTQEKIDQAKSLEKPLTRFRLANRAQYEDPESKKYKFIDKVPPKYDAQGELYYQMIRAYRDAGESEDEQRTRAELKQKLWDHLSVTLPTVAAQLGGEENMLVLAYTLRDKIERDQLAIEEVGDEELI